MSKQNITLRVPVDASWDAGDRLQIYTDQGSGTIDFNAPLLPRPAEIYPGKHAARGLGRQPVGLGRTGDKRPARSGSAIGRSSVGRTPLGRPLNFVAVDVEVPAAFGLWKFAAKVVDVRGVPQSGAGAELAAVVSGTDPPPLSAFDFVSIQGGQAVFGFTRGAD